MVRRPSLAVSGIVVAVALLLTGCSGAQSRFTSHLRRAQQLYAQGDFVKANVEVRNAMQIAPKDTGARLLAAHTAEKLARPRDAASLYQSVIDANPDSTEARVGLARLMVLGGAPEQAAKILEPAAAKHPDDPAVLTWRSAARNRLKDHAGAIIDADRALALAPTDADAVAERAGLYTEDGDVEHAVALIKGAVEHDPKSVDMHEILANLYAGAGRLDEADAQLRALIGLKPQELRYRTELAVFYLRTQRIDDAQRALEEGVRALPKSDEAKLALAEFVDAQRDPGKAAQLLRGYLAQDPDDSGLRLALGALLERAPKVGDPVAVYEEVIRREKIHPNGLVARDRLAGIDFAKGRYDEVRARIDEVIRENPRDIDALTLRARLALVKRDRASAIADLRAVLKDQPQASGIRLLLARALADDGDLPLAEETLHAGLDLAPADAALRIELAQVLMRLQHADEAVKLLEEATVRAPSDAELRVALARAYLAAHDFAKARAEAADIDTLRPKLPAGAYLAALAAEGADQPDEAQRQYERALALEPGNFEMLSALARLEMKRGRLADAAALIKASVDADPSNAPDLNLLGQIYFAQKNLPLADATLSRATQLAPDWWVPWRNLALVKMAANDGAGAIAAYQAGVKAAPGEPQVAAELAYLYERLGRIDDAIGLYESMYRRDPRAQAVANNLAMLLVNYRKDKASLDRARDLTAGFTASNDGTLLDTNGWVHFKRAEYDEALPVLQRAAEQAPQSREIRCHLGLAEWRVGHSDQARTDLEAGLAGKDSFAGADEARTALAQLTGRAS